MTHRHKRMTLILLLPLMVGCWLVPGFSSFNSVAFASPAGGTLVVGGVGSLTLPEWLSATEAKGLENQKNAGLQYDLVGFSGDVWHYARLVSYRLEQNLGPAALLFSLAESNPQVLGELARPLLEKSLAENGGKILEWSQARKSSFGGRSVPTISARLIMTEKAPLPMAAKVYVFMHKDRIVAFGLFAPDSDRVFWEKTGTGLFGQLAWEL